MRDDTLPGSQTSDQLSAPLRLLISVCAYCPSLTPLNGADADKDAAWRGMMTSSCDCPPPSHVHPWVPWQRVRRARPEGVAPSLCCYEERGVLLSRPRFFLYLPLSPPQSPSSVFPLLFSSAPHLPDLPSLSWQPLAQPIRARSGGRA